MIESKTVFLIFFSSNFIVISVSIIFIWFRLTKIKKYILFKERSEWVERFIHLEMKAQVLQLEDNVEMFIDRYNLMWPEMFWHIEKGKLLFPKSIMNNLFPAGKKYHKELRDRKNKDCFNKSSLLKILLPYLKEIDI